ncbi:hypothetical protein BCR34DRAFT_497416 [Clohesyomyces aquaticus]|uniref:BTB domain-containing protein n=1 Tax=Clohesyomyces aquaticus TaxID=1231657 RepID=A0A1Y1YG23_9PLEO|nr:hypothetical protein BCR34DRAFT_497416 [Clohesyomyces aquaticus]
MQQPEDVEIILTSEHRYKLHANVLARHSTFFAGYLTEQRAAKYPPRTLAKGVIIRWMFQLKRGPTEEEPAGELSPVNLDHNGQPLCPMHVTTLNENGKVPSKFYKYYESVLYACYGSDIPIGDEGADMMTALNGAANMLEIADYLGCIPVISKPIDIALFNHGQTLFRAIQAAPSGWAGLAMRIKSEMMFKEAVIHLAGNWNSMKSEDRDALDAGVRAVVEKHHRILTKKRQGVESRLASCYPGNMSAPGEFRPIKREEYAKDILVWIALSFFRHWFAQQIIIGKGGAGPDGGFGLYTMIVKGGDQYMEKPIMNEFHERFPLTKKAMNVLENHLAEMKVAFKDLVQRSRILESLCQLDTHKFPVGYLTCVELDRDDYPWNREVGDEDDPAAFRSSSAVAEMGFVAANRPTGNQVVQKNLAAARRHASDDNGPLSPGKHVRSGGGGGMSTSSDGNSNKRARNGT